MFVLAASRILPGIGERIMAKGFADDSRVRTRALQAYLVLKNSELVRCPIL